MRSCLKKKKGISPVIATTLLILIAVIIALIIFLWVKAFIGEKIQKTVGNEPEAIENFCNLDQLQFSANVLFDGTNNKLIIEIQNSENIPLQGIQVKKKGFASVKDIGSAEFNVTGPLTSGDDGVLEMDANGVSSGDNVRIIGVLLGETSKGIKKEYACSKNYFEVEVN